MGHNPHSLFITWTVSSAAIFFFDSFKHTLGEFHIGHMWIQCSYSLLLDLGTQCILDMLLTAQSFSMTTIVDWWQKDEINLELCGEGESKRSEIGIQFAIRRSRWAFSFPDPFGSLNTFASCKFSIEQCNGYVTGLSPWDKGVGRFCLHMLSRYGKCTYAYVSGATFLLVMALNHYLNNDCSFCATASRKWSFNYNCTVPSAGIRVSHRKDEKLLPRLLASAATRAYTQRQKSQRIQWHSWTFVLMSTRPHRVEL